MLQFTPVALKIYGLNKPGLLLVVVVVTLKIKAENLLKGNDNRRKAEVAAEVAAAVVIAAT